MKPERLKELVEKLSSARIGVLGDFFLDHYLVVDPKLAEPSVETGKVAHQVEAIRSQAGAAGTVINNLSALGVEKLFAFGVTGEDGYGWQLRNLLNELGCGTEGLVTCHDLLTPVYIKPVDRGRQGLSAEHSRYDIRNRRATPEKVTQAVLEQVERRLPELDALILVDQVENESCETVTPLVREWFQRLASHATSTLFWADSRFHIDEFRGVWIKPNHYEVMGHVPTGPTDRVDFSEIKKGLPRLRSRNGAPVTVTLGQDGMWISDPLPKQLPAFPIEGPVDSTGAGDSVTAGMVAALCVGATHEEAGWIGNLVASITVMQLGTTGTASPSQVFAQLNEWRTRCPDLFSGLP